MNYFNIIIGFFCLSIVCFPFISACILATKNCNATLEKINKINSGLETIRIFETMCKEGKPLQEIINCIDTQITEYTCIEKNKTVYGIDMHIHNLCITYYVGVSK